MAFELGLVGYEYKADLPRPHLVMFLSFSSEIPSFTGVRAPLPGVIDSSYSHHKYGVHSAGPFANIASFKLSHTFTRKVFIIIILVLQI
jgi:hypothetical protein